MKYRLKKSLPFAKVGEPIVVTKGLSYTILKYIVSNEHCLVCDVPNEKLDEWIEEVKPREFWLLDCDNPKTLWREEEKNKEIGKHPNFKFIRYEEVIE